MKVKRLLTENLCHVLEFGLTHRVFDIILSITQCHKMTKFHF
jgi:hypothetical protein